MTRDKPLVMTGWHVHVHNWEGGERRFEHEHDHPVDDKDPLRAKPHAHSNGRHSHPHGHSEYVARKVAA